MIFVKDKHRRTGWLCTSLRALLSQRGFSCKVIAEILHPVLAQQRQLDKSKYGILSPGNHIYMQKFKLNWKIKGLSVFYLHKYLCSLQKPQKKISPKTKHFQSHLLCIGEYQPRTSAALLLVSPSREKIGFQAMVLYIHRPLQPLTHAPYCDTNVSLISCLQDFQLLMLQLPVRQPALFSTPQESAQLLKNSSSACKHISRSKCHKRN